MTTPPQGPSSPHAARAGFGEASAERDNRRLGPFNECQILQLHRFHAEMQSCDKLSELTFDYGHNFCRATFLLVTPVDTEREIKLWLMEQREHDGSYTYNVSALLDGVLHAGKDVSKHVRGRSAIPDCVFQSLRVIMIELNGCDFSGLQTGGQDGVVSLQEWRIAHRGSEVPEAR